MDVCIKITVVPDEPDAPWDDTITCAVENPLTAVTQVIAIIVQTGGVMKRLDDSTLRFTPLARVRSITAELCRIISAPANVPPA